MNYRTMGTDGKEWRPPSGPSVGGNGLQALPPAGLVRQSSVYSLTFDEFQSTVGGFGKDFGSMNMDELLKSIWTAEETQAMTSAAAMATTGVGGTAGSVMAGVQRQGSLTLPRTLSQKTVDEVWKDLFKEGGEGGQGLVGSFLNPQQRQPTLGEMTLEEFLVRAGVVREDLAVPASRPTINTANNSHMLYGDVPASQLNGNAGLPLGFPAAARSSAANPVVNNSLAAIAPNPVPNHSLANSLMMNVSSVRPPMPLTNAPELASQGGMRTGGMMGIGDQMVNGGLLPGMVELGTGGITVAAGSPANHPPSDGFGRANGDLSSLSPVPYAFNGGLRGRKCSGALEKVVERRQRRMIKNRESAARSRARKQAYTMELEAEVAKLKEQNQELEKKQVEILETQKNQVLEMINKERGSKKRCLRRTQTGPW
uniref:ABSCISIC ACID-INSENSITIVE 5-like protein 5 n=1 Tax=Anthurium amnicola TaxID=1678845 RepID=A0A1D1XUZ4_9ARAE